MAAINNGVRYITGMQWLIDSASKKQAIDLDDSKNANMYIVKDKANEKKWGFKLIETLSIPRKSKLFDGIIFVVPDGVYGRKCPPREEILKVISSGGGRLLDSTTAFINVSSNVITIVN